MGERVTVRPKNKIDHRSTAHFVVEHTIQQKNRFTEQSNWT